MRRALATGYALALAEHDLFHTHPGHAVNEAILEFADWFAARTDWSLARAYQHWRAHLVEFPPVSIPPQTPRSTEARPRVS